MNKGYSPPTKSIHDMVKKGYTKTHIKNAKNKKFKGFKSPSTLNKGFQPGLEEGDNNIEEQS